MIGCVVERLLSALVLRLGARFLGISFHPLSSFLGGGGGWLMGGGAGALDGVGSERIGGGGAGTMG